MFLPLCSWLLQLSRRVTVPPTCGLGVTLGHIMAFSRVPVPLQGSPLSAELRCVAVLVLVGCSAPWCQWLCLAEEGETRR